MNTVWWSQGIQNNIASIRLTTIDLNMKPSLPLINRNEDAPTFFKKRIIRASTWTSRYDTQRQCWLQYTFIFVHVFFFHCKFTIASEHVQYLEKHYFRGKARPAGYLIYCTMNHFHILGNTTAFFLVLNVCQSSVTIPLISTFNLFTFSLKHFLFCSFVPISKYVHPNNFREAYNQSYWGEMKGACRTGTYNKWKKATIKEMWLRSMTETSSLKIIPALYICQIREIKHIPQTHKHTSQFDLFHKTFSFSFLSPSLSTQTN